MPVLDLFRLDGKPALVTGAASGIGRAICLAMAEAGADVACVDRNAAGAEEAAAEVKARGRHALAMTADVGDAEQVDSAVGRAARTFGTLEIVCANAGISGRAGPTPLGEIPPEVWQEVIDVNLSGIFHTIQAATRVMRPQKRGKIVLTASVLGLRAFRNGGAHAYSAAKAGVISLARSAALSLASDGIRVNAMAPGFVATPIWGMERSAFDSNPQMLEAANQQPLGRWAEPEEVAALAVYLASPAADFLTGTTVAIDGGITAALGGM
jgi:NAD(P)-dependent dehydrogenase (short-subunit alcohol dehydrogenase family)